jgi:glycosyltransferase involved in cell wall biosynthesis
MNLAINALSSRKGGGATYLRNLLRYLEPTKGLTVQVFAPRGLELPSSSHVRLVHPRWPTANPLLRTLWEVLVLPRYLRKHKTDVLFCPGGVVSTRVPPNCKIVTMFRNMMPFDRDVVTSMPMGFARLRVMILRPVLLWSLTKADLVIFVSKFGESVVSRLVSIQNSCVILHGTSDDFRTSSKMPPWPPVMKNSSRYILYVSAFLPYKNHMTVIGAYEKLPEPMRRTYKMVFAGQMKGPEADQVCAFIAGAGLAENVIMLNEILHESLPSLYRHADLIVFASSCENCPNILIEALAAGRPVLCSNVMPMPEIGGDAPRYFAPSDADDLAQAMKHVLSEPNYAMALANAAEKRSECFDARSSARETWKQILALVA